MRGAVLRIVVETGTGNAGDADLFDEVAGETDVGGFGGGAILRGELKARSVRHDVVGAARFIDSEAGGFEDGEEALAFFCVTGGEIVVIVLRKLQRECASLLQGSCGADGQEIVDLADGLRGIGRSEGPAGAPAGNTVGRACPRCAPWRCARCRRRGCARRFRR